MLKRNLKNQLGVSLFELTIIAPVLIVLVTGAIHYGLGIRTVQSISAAARQGARLAAQKSSDALIPCQHSAATSLSCSQTLATTGATFSGLSVEFYGKLGACEFLSQNVPAADLDNWDVSVTVDDDPVIDLLVGTNTPAPIEKSARVLVSRNATADPTGFYCVICFEDLALETGNIAVQSGFLLEAECS